jgi:ATP-dependent DNA ligase
MLARIHKDLTHDYPTDVAAIRTVRRSSVLQNGEIVALDQW